MTTTYTAQSRVSAAASAGQAVRLLTRPGVTPESVSLAHRSGPGQARGQAWRFRRLQPRSLDIAEGVDRLRPCHVLPQIAELAACLQ